MHFLFAFDIAFHVWRRSEHICHCNVRTLLCFSYPVFDWFWISQIIWRLAALRATKMKITGSVGRLTLTDPRPHAACVAQCYWL